MTKDEVLMKALEMSLIELLRRVPKNARLIVDNADGMSSRSHPVGYLCHKAAEALEQPAQEPVAWMEVKKDAGFKCIEVWQEPVSKNSIPLYTHPAPSPWQGNKEFVGLSNDRIREIGDNCLENNNGLFNWIDFARAIEQASRIKNGY